jgi:hypothetical protein
MIATAAVISTFSWVYLELAPVEISGQWVFSGPIHVVTKAEENNVFDHDVYNGWSVPVIQSGNDFSGYDGHFEVIRGVVGGKDINFVLEISDEQSVDGCGDYSNFTGTLEKSGFFSPYNKIAATMEGHDCESWTKWTGEFTIHINKDKP